MHAKVFLAASLAATASANNLDERDAQQCAIAAAKVTTLFYQIPQPAPTLSRFFVQESITMTVSCELPAVTGSMAQDASSYFTTLSQWYDSHKTEFKNVLDACSDVPAVREQLESASLCSTISFAKETGSSDGDNKGTTGGGDNTTTQATPTPANPAGAGNGGGSTQGNGATRQTGMVMAAGVVAGIALIALN